MGFGVWRKSSGHFTEKERRGREDFGELIFPQSGCFGIQAADKEVLGCGKDLKT
jgi:hypothetical protein